MSREKRDYFFAAFDAHLRGGYAGPEALKRAAHNYAHVFYGDDDKTPLSRAAGIALKELLGEEADPPYIIDPVAYKLLYEYVKAFSEESCCKTPGCSTEDPLCDAMTARSVLALVTEKGEYRG